MLIKNILLLVNVFFLLIFQSLFEGGVSVTQTIPASAQPGSEFTVEVLVNKGEVSGFAKFAQELPGGCNVTPVEVSGGNFSFTDNTVKVIWMALPAEKEFKLSYKVSVGSSVNGDFQVGGKLSYLENNEKKTAEITPSSIKIGSGSDNNSTATAAPAPVENTAAPATASNETPATTANEQSPSTSSAAAPSGSASAKRNAPSSTSTAEFTVEVVVNKGAIAGFAKLEENIPAGFTATGVETQGASFSVVENKVKFLWMSLPQATEFKISYKLTGPSDFKGAAKIDGLFSYLENEETRKAVIDVTTTNVGSGDQAAPVIAAAGADNTTAKQSNTTTETPVVASKPKPVTKIASPSAGSAGLVYRVQVCAVHTNVPNTFFNDAYKIPEEVFSETHEGWFKYTTGTFGQYSEARNKRESLSQNSLINTGPFVTAYNNGNRITVQEALMISRQSWVR